MLISVMANIQHLLDTQPEPRYTLKKIGEIAETCLLYTSDAADE